MGSNSFFIPCLGNPCSLAAEVDPVLYDSVILTSSLILLFALTVLQIQNITRTVQFILESKLPLNVLNIPFYILALKRHVKIKRKKILWNDKS